MRRQAGVLLAAMVIGAGLGALIGAGPAVAGGWAVTVVDPPPGDIEAGKPYRVSFWVLQHGTHPYSWDQPPSIGPVGLTLADERGTSVSFPGRALAEPAHYATTVTVPRAGTWRVTGVQGIFADFHVGTLTVPGTLAALGVPAAPSPADLQRYWPGTVRPPVLPIDHTRDPFVEEPAQLGQPAGGERAAPPAAAPAASTDRDGAAEQGWGIPAPSLAVVLGGAVLLVGLAAGVRKRWTRRVAGP